MDSILKYTLIILFYLVCNFSLTKKIYSQKIDTVAVLYQKLDDFYGLNTELINGIKYYPYYTNYDGSPYWNDSEPQLGSITINGNRYTNQKLQYELNKQEFILTFKDKIGAENQIIINPQTLDSVMIDNHLFIKSNNKSIKERYVEIVYFGKISGYFGFYKEVKFVSSDNKACHTYSKIDKTNYLIYQNDVKTFKNNNGFLKLMPQEIKPALKDYFTKEKLKIRKANQEQFKSLFEYCNSLLNK